jgi:hypothetical protein
MATHILNYRSTPPVVQIERTEAKRVMVRVVYPPGKLRDAILGIAAIGCFYGMFAALWYHIFSMQPSLHQRWIPLLVLAPMPIVVILFAAWSVWGVCQSYTFHADREGITIIRQWRRRERSERLPREQINDVRLGFGKGGRGGGGGAWLIIDVKPWYRWNRRLLGNLGGNHLAQVADALRTGIGLPPRSWP